MKLNESLVGELMVQPGSSAGLRGRSTEATTEDWLGPLGKSHPKDVAARDLDALKEELERAQELLYAHATWALLVILQGPDASGKDGTIKHVMSGVNPQGCDVVSFKEPTGEELAHDFLWRCSKALPERGHVGIFNRSYYEEVIVTRVHPDLIAAERIPSELTADPAFFERRFEDINNFEKHLERNGTRIVKILLHVSKEEQRRRLLARLDDPAKRWKLSPTDALEHQLFDRYEEAYEAAVTATSTPWSPWYVVPADHKMALRALVGGIIVHVIDSMKFAAPPPDPRQDEMFVEARRILGT